MGVENDLTAEEQAAFDNVVRWLPGATVGPLEPRRRAAGGTKACSLDRLD